MTDDLRRRAMLANLVDQLQGLEYDALRVVKRVADRLVLGRERYGDLDLAKPRPWRRERNEELLDAIVYEVAYELAAEDAAREALHERARAEILAAPPPIPPEVLAERDRLVARDNIRSEHFAHCTYEEQNGFCKRDGFGRESHCDECYEAARRPAAPGTALREYRDRAPVPEERRREALQLIGPVSVGTEPYESELEGPEYDFEGGGAG